MATVTNDSTDGVDVPAYGLVFEAGETQTVDDDVAASLGYPFKVEFSAAARPASSVAAAGGGGTPAAPAQPSGAVEPPADIAAAQAELAKAQADLAASEAAQAPVVPAGE